MAEPSWAGYSAEPQARGLTPEQVVGALAASVGLWPADQLATPGDLLGAFNPASVSPQPSAIAL